MDKLQIHPLANLLPRMTDAEFGALVADIGQLGFLREPIVLLDGAILDGRHRADACERLGITPATIDFDPAWGSPVRYVYSKAVHRNLTDSQKAAAAVLIEEEIGKEAKERSAANLKQHAGDGGNFATSETERVEGKTRKQWEMWLGSLSMKRLEAEVAKRNPDGGKLGNLNFKEMKELLLGIIFPPKPDFAGDIAQGIVGAGGAKRGAWQWPEHTGKSRSEIEAWLKSLPRKSLRSEFDACVIERMKRTGGNVLPVDRPYLEMVAFILDETFGPVPSSKSRDIAGTLFGVSGRYVQDAKLIYKQQPKLFADVMAGTLTLSRANSEVRRSAKRAALKLPSPPPAEGTPDWKVLVGDCEAVMETLPRHAARLAFWDGPYNLKIDYGDGKKADNLPQAEYLAKWGRVFKIISEEMLTPDGSLWVLIADEWADHFGLLLRQAGLHRRNWIKWYETFGANCSDKFNRTSRHLFYCVRDPKRCVFNHDAVRRLSDRQAKYNDPRASPGGKLWDDVWGINPPIPRLNDNSPERLPDFPTQLPIELLRRVIAVATDPGDLVLDPAAGSCTAGAAAIQLGRRSICIEKNPLWSRQATARLSMVRVAGAVSS